MKRTQITALGATMLLALAALPAQAQDAPKPAADAAAGGNNNRPRTPEEFRQRMEERMKTSLKASDDEWKVLQPLIEKVVDAQRQAGGGGRFGRGPGGPGGAPAGGTAPAPGATGGNTAQNRGGSPESQALRDALEDENSSPETIKAKLSALRESRKKGTADLATARENLRKMLTVRQEAALVSMNILD